MKLPAALLVLALLAGSVALADHADASPLNPAASALQNVQPLWVQVREPGYYRTVVQNVWVPARIIGYDIYGNAIVRPGFYRTVARQVFVPGRIRWVFFG